MPPIRSRSRSMVGLQNGLQRDGQTGCRVTNHLKDYVEHRSVQLAFSQNRVQLPSSVRSTFLMVFAPDGEKVASTHGDHKIYISCLKSGKMLQTLEGHPRTPWCLDFHPTLRDVVASGCLAGEVRVWDLRSGACETWVNTHGSVIASISFHPADHLILIATCNELHFWDWRRSSQPSLTLTTSSDKERVRFVKFDATGSKILTGISNLPPVRLGPVPPFSTFTPVVRSPPASSASSVVPPDFIFSNNLSGLAHETGRQADLVPSASNSNALLRRSQLFNRVLQMGRQLEGIEETAIRNREAESPTPAERPDRLPESWYRNPLSSATASSEPVPSTSSSSGPAFRSDYSGNLTVTFRKLHALCTRLAVLMSDQPDTLRGGGRDFRSVEASASLNELLSRLHSSLQNMSNAALHTAMAQEQIQQVRQRVSEILDRLANVNGYRMRLSSLRDQIAAVAERYASGAEPELERSQRTDLLHCLCLVEMSIALTRQMQHILTRDYRISQMTLSNAQQTIASPDGGSNFPSTSASSSSSRHVSDDPQPSTSGLMSPASPPPTPSSGNSGDGSSGSRSRFHPYDRLSFPRYRSSLSSPSASPFESGPAPFSIPLVRVSEPDDLSPASEEAPESVFVRETLARDRPRSPPLSSEVQRLLGVTLGSTINGVNIPDPATFMVSGPDVEVRQPERLPRVVPPSLPDVLPGSIRPGGQPHPHHLWFHGAPLAWPVHMGPELGWLGNAASISYRLQCWNYSSYELPNLKDPHLNVIASKCRIHNDASVDVSADGSLLAALVSCENSASVDLCIFSLAKNTFAQRLCSWSFGGQAVSVSLSPLSRFVVVGLATPRAGSQLYSSPPSNESVTVGQVFQLNKRDKDTSLEHVRNINVCRGDESFSLNSIRWLPNPGDGFIYGTNRGHLVICRPEASIKTASGKLMSSNTSFRNSNSTGTQTFLSLTMTVPQRPATSIGTQTPDHPEQDSRT